MNSHFQLANTQFASVAAKNNPLADILASQIATRQAAGDMSSFFGLLPNPDPVLRAMGQSISAYRSLLADPLVMGLRRRRIAAVLTMQSGFHPDNCKRTSPAVLQACKKMLTAHNIPNLVRDWMDGAFFGYRVSEVMWQLTSAGVMPARVIAKPSEWFGFEPVNSELYFKPRASMTGVPVPIRKFIVVGRMRSWDNPYGEADLAACFWPVTFKRAGLKFWMTFTEKYGMPWAVGKLPRQASSKDVDDLADKLDRMVRDAVAVVPDDSSVEFMNVNGDFNADLFERFIMFCRSEISIALLGNNQSVEADSNLASAQAARKVEAYLREDDAQMVADGFNQLVRMYCEVNYPSAVPPVYGFWEQEEIDEQRIARDELLVKAGAVFTDEYWKRTYNLQDGDITPTPASKRPLPSRSQSESISAQSTATFRLAALRRLGMRQ